jgi:hypothetical protein
MIADLLQPPSELDPAADAYKDWLHLNVFDHSSGAVMLLNGSIHGPPSDPRCRAIGTALMHGPNGGWTGNVVVRNFKDAIIGANSIAMEQLAIAVDREGERVLASASFCDDGLAISVAARAYARSIDVEEHLPFGPGWISWYVVPRLIVSGTFSSNGHAHDLSNASAYHDHNWGRWHWGEDVGWEWGAFLTPSPGPVLIASCVTDRAHRLRGEPLLFIESSDLRRRFVGLSLDVRLEGRLEAPIRRMPGGLAALHQDRANPTLPSRVHIRADDGVDKVDLELQVTGAAQVIAGEPTQPGYGFIHEMVGEFRASAVIGGACRTWQGLAVFEYVD